MYIAAVNGVGGHSEPLAPNTHVVLTFQNLTKCRPTLVHSIELPGLKTEQKEVTWKT
jgi:hypothetical protein